MPSGFRLAQHQATAYESFTSVFMDGSAKLLVERAGIGEGDVVLDLACGTGLVARHAVAVVAPGGHVIGADINPAMLDVARGMLDVGVEWVEASCDALPIDDAVFTHVVCQQGFQFFPASVGAMREAKRVLRPGGALIATVWATPGQNPYIENQLDLLVGLDPAVAASVRRATPPDADVFLQSTAQIAGFDDIEITLLEHDVLIADFEPWFLAQTGGTPWGPTLGALDAVAQQRLAADMAARLEPYAGDGGQSGAATGAGHLIPFRSHCLIARCS